MPSFTPTAQALLSALLLFTSVSPAFAQREAGKVAVPANVEVLTGVEFGRGGGRALKLNLVRPKNSPAAPMPVVVFIHGGGWRGGNSQGGIAKLTSFAERGYVGASIEYRLSGEASFPAPIEDAKCAIRFLRAKAKEYNLDPNRIGVWGMSAGGQLANLLGTSSDVKALEGSGGYETFSSRVQAVADWYGPADMTLMLKTSSQGGVEAVSTMLGKSPAEIKKHAEEASAIKYLSKDDPPFFILHGDQDTTVPVGQSELFHAALQKMGVESTLHIAKGIGHNVRGAEYDQMAADFFDRHLKPAAPAKSGSN